VFARVCLEADAGLANVEAAEQSGLCGSRLRVEAELLVCWVYWGECKAIDARREKVICCGDGPCVHVAGGDCSGRLHLRPTCAGCAARPDYYFSRRNVGDLGFKSGYGVVNVVWFVGR
jgi:hypothetical protein